MHLLASNKFNLWSKCRGSIFIECLKKNFQVIPYKLSYCNKFECLVNSDSLYGSIKIEFANQTVGDWETNFLRGWGYARLKSIEGLLYTSEDSRIVDAPGEEKKGIRRLGRKKKWRDERKGKSEGERNWKRSICTYNRGLLSTDEAFPREPAHEYLRSEGF